MAMGTGMPINTSRKQKLNNRSSTESELVGADDMAQMILWTKFFVEEQGHDVKENILYQDNMSTILLENNGKRSSGKRTRAINIRYFFLTDQVEKGNLRIEYCPTEEMNGDYMSKSTALLKVQSNTRQSPMFSTVNIGVYKSMHGFT